jgi:hypothetical protein
VNYVLRLKEAPADVLFDIDEPALRSVAEKLGRVGSSAGIKGTIELGSLLSLPGVIRPACPGDEQIEQIKEVILRISQAALDKLKQMRAVEGGFLEADLNKRCKAIEDDLEQINARSPIVLQKYSEKLKKRVNELLAHRPVGYLRRGRPAGFSPAAVRPVLSGQRTGGTQTRFHQPGDAPRGEYHRQQGLGHGDYKIRRGYQMPGGSDQGTGPKRRVRKEMNIRTYRGTV